MGYPINDAGHFLLDVDASGYGLGGVLAQLQNEREKVISYASRSLTKHEKNYCITEKELLAVVYFVQYFRQYLLGRKFIVRTDHQALVWLFSLKEPSGKIARWTEILAPYDFSIEYRTGNKQGHCDALSRCISPRDCSCNDLDMSEPLKCGPCRKCVKRASDMLLDIKKGQGVAEQRETMENQDGVRALREDQTPGCSHEPDAKDRKVKSNWLEMFNSEAMALKQKQDPDLKIIIKALEANEKPNMELLIPESPSVRHYAILWDNLVLEGGVLYKHFKSKDGIRETNQLLVPRALRGQVIAYMHDSITAGHLGIKKTKAKISQSFFWYNMREDITLYVKGCDICASDKKPHRTPRAPMGHLRAGAPWDFLAVDYTGPFPITSRGNRYILVMTDHFSKYVEVFPVPNQTAEDCALRIMSNVIARWGTPLSIHSDQGAAFESKVFKELCRIMQVKKTRTSARNPRGNGQVERFNRTLLKTVRAYLVDEQEDWDLYLEILAGTYRATPHESTGLSPNLLAIGREIRMPADLIFGHDSVAAVHSSSPVDYVQKLKGKVEHAHDVARKHLRVNAKRSKEIYDVKMSFHQYGVGDLVWCLHECKKQGIAPKLEKAYSGPFVIVEKRSPVSFVIRVNKNGQDRVVHHNKLKPYEGNNAQKWLRLLAKNLKSN